MWKRVEETLSFTRVKAFRNGGQRMPTQMLARASLPLSEDTEVEGGSLPNVPPPHIYQQGDGRGRLVFTNE
jgi:hypothetical protein